mgnify:CR=1 FL=1
MLGINLTGAFFTLKHAGEAMVRSGGGAFVGISSIAAPLTHPFMSAYCVSKVGLEALIRTAADELGRANVRVNAVRPGIVPTELAAPLEQDPAVLADYLAQMPVSRTGTVDDVGALVRFLCGPESSWITGQCIGVDGGHRWTVEVGGGRLSSRVAHGLRSDDSERQRAQRVRLPNEPPPAP